jgi:hypothetical protein
LLITGDVKIPSLDGEIVFNYVPKISENASRPSELNDMIDIRWIYDEVYNKMFRKMGSMPLQVFHNLEFGEEFEFKINLGDNFDVALHSIDSNLEFTYRFAHNTNILNRYVDTSVFITFKPEVTQEYRTETKIMLIPFENSADAGAPYILTFFVNRNPNYQNELFRNESFAQYQESVDGFVYKQFTFTNDDFKTYAEAIYGLGVPPTDFVNNDFASLEEDIINFEYRQIRRKI